MGKKKEVVQSSTLVFPEISGNTGSRTSIPVLLIVQGILIKRLFKYRLSLTSETRTLECQWGLGGFW